MAKKKSAKKAAPSGEVRVFGHYECLACHHTEFEHLHEIPSMAYHGTLADGSKYTAVHRERVACAECGAISVLSRYEFDPKRWRA